MLPVVVVFGAIRMSVCTRRVSAARESDIMHTDAHLVCKFNVSDQASGWCMNSEGIETFSVVAMACKH